jgi:hypothetical protein
MVRGYVPATVEPAAVTCIVELPDPATEVGLKLAVAPLGSPLTENPTLPVKPPEAVMLTV